MRRSSASKKTGQSYSTPTATDLFRSASSKASSKESERIDSLFYSFANASTGMIEYITFPDVGNEYLPRCREALNSGGTD